ncbi:MAG: class I SAM-dependent methyltransferase [Dehalococcoidia bacterium]|nr:MAG: class I SAM-dependent methyltransferase [Dehalococcoidia bacterium]
MSKDMVRLYENEGFQTAAHEALRPGGLDLTKKAMDIARFAQRSRILDIGSGCGKTLEYLTEVLDMQAMGIDISDKLAVKTKKLNSTLEIVIGDACQLPCANGSVDGVICECVFNLLEDRPLALAQMNRVLTPDGRLIISDLYLREKKGNFSGLPIATCINGITARENVIREITAAGFQLIDWQDETDVYKEFVAGLIMKYGSMSVFWESLVGSCEKTCDIRNNLRNVRIGYYLSVWNKCPGR